MVISPSILAADFLNLEKDIKRLNNTNCEWIHLDVMDGKFVQDITFGYPLIEKIAQISTKKLDVHLMVEHPQDLVKRLCSLNISYLTIHAEVIQNVDFNYLNELCTKNNIQFGLAINPDTQIEQFKDYINKINYVLLMSVYPGKGGQSFKEEILQKEKDIRALENGKNIIINIDGGVNGQTISKVKETSIDTVVSGSYIFSNNMQENIDSLR